MKNHVLWVRSIIGIALWLFWSVGYGQLNANWSIPGYSWEYQYGGSGTDRVLSVTETNDGGFIYFGVTNSTNGDVVGNHGGYDIWIVKTDSNGTGGWKKCIGGSGNDSLRQVFPMPNGHYLLLGHTTSNNGDISGNHGGKDGWLAEIDSAGGIVWQKCLGGTGNDNLVQGIIRNGVITMMGNTLSSDGDVSGSLGGGDIWVLQTDMSGNLLFNKCVGGTDYDRFFSFLVDYHGNYYLDCSSFSEDLDMFNVNFPPPGWGGFLFSRLLKLDTTFSLLTNEFSLHENWGYDFNGFLRLNNDSSVWLIYPCYVEYTNSGSIYGIRIDKNNQSNKKFLSGSGWYDASSYPANYRTEYAYELLIQDTQNDGFVTIVYNFDHYYDYGFNETYKRVEIETRAYNSDGTQTDSCGINYYIEPATPQTWFAPYGGNNVFTPCNSFSPFVYKDWNPIKGDYPPLPDAIVNPRKPNGLSWGASGSFKDAGVPYFQDTSGGYLYEFLNKNMLSYNNSSLLYNNRILRGTHNGKVWEKEIDQRYIENVQYLKARDSICIVLGEYDDAIPVNNYDDFNYWLAAIAGPSNLLGGRVWRDANGNGVYDSGEGVGNEVLKIESLENSYGAFYVNTDSVGKYRVLLGVDSIRISLGSVPLYHISTPPKYVLDLLSGGFTDTTLNIGLIPASSAIADLESGLTALNDPNPGFTTPYHVSVQNKE